MSWPEAAVNIASLFATAIGFIGCFWAIAWAVRGMSGR